MKVSIIAALTADGLIARDANHLATSWTSKEDTRHFMRLSKEAKYLVMGANQYRTINRGLPGRHIFVYSHNPIEADGVEVVTEEPEKLVKRLEKQGIEHLMICGGSATYGMFMRAALVDEFYLTIEPTMFGTGLTLFNDSVELDLHFQLESVEQQGDSVFLHYVKK